MPRKLKVYQTSIGFFELLIAAPSMKAALAAWGTTRNLSHEGVAKEADDPAIVEAAMNQPGVVLGRPVGTDKVFKEDAELPTSLSRDTYRRKPPRSKAKKHTRREVAGEDERKAALAYEKEQEKQEGERKKQEAAEAKAAARRDKAITKAKSALEAAEQENEETTAAIAERAALDRREEEQKQRWLERKNKLEAALRRAREG
jgi:hypothetical protein